MRSTGNEKTLQTSRGRDKASADGRHANGCRPRRDTPPPAWPRRATSGLHASAAPACVLSARLPCARAEHWLRGSQHPAGRGRQRCPVTLATRTRHRCMHAHATQVRVVTRTHTRVSARHEYARSRHARVRVRRPWSTVRRSCPRGAALRRTRSASRWPISARRRRRPTRPPPTRRRPKVASDEAGLRCVRREPPRAPRARGVASRSASRSDRGDVAWRQSSLWCSDEVKV